MLTRERRSHPEVLPLPERRVSSRAWLPLAGLLGIVVVRLGLSLVARATGFLEYNADGYARIVHAAAWAREPYLEISVWLPLHFWALGLWLRLWPDLLLAPVALSFVLSVLSAWFLALTAARLGGWPAGLVAGALAAIFPWSVWFGLSGLVEAPFAAAVAAAAFGLVGWLRDGRMGHLWLAAICLLISAALRYEGWFFSAAFAAIILLGGGSRSWRRPEVVGAALVPFAFPVAWMAANLLAAGDAFAFARVTSEITAAEGTHENLSAVERLIFYPVFFAGLVWPFALSATGALVLHRRRRDILLYAGWALGELAILSLVTSRFSGIGAGRDRYVMSNAVLLLPLCALLVVALWRGGGWRRLASVGVVALLVWFSTMTLLTRQHLYPDPATVQVAATLRAAWEAGRLPADLALPVEMPPPGRDPTYNERYALEVLTNRAGRFHFVPDLALFNRLVADQAPTAWITDNRLLNPGRPVAASQDYIGPYTIHWRPLPPRLALAGTPRAGGYITLTGAGFEADEVVGIWLTGPDGGIYDLGQLRADSQGQLDHALTLPSDLVPGNHTLSARGARTGATGHVALAVA